MQFLKLKGYTHFVMHLINIMQIYLEYCRSYHNEANCKQNTFLYKILPKVCFITNGKSVCYSKYIVILQVLIKLSDDRNNCKHVSLKYT